MKSPNKKILTILFILLVSWFSMHTVSISLDGLTDDTNAVDVAIVFGNEVTPAGQPSDRLKARLDKAVEVFHNKQAKTFIVSGGIGKEGVDEAKVMAKYLAEHKIPQENIIIDSNGIDTESTARNSAKIMRQNNYYSALLISQFYHISRAKLAFQKAGVTELYSVHPNYFELRDFYSTFREFFAYYSYLI